ncbi:MAG: hypothetical protein FJ026_11500 [Chloroflexi bacterium]|nr:hypothetical protein [Chloroflexota bacterium]
MKAKTYFPWGLVIISLALAAFELVPLGLAVPILVVALYAIVYQYCFYRPPEDHLGVLYRFGRFARWVSPHEWAVRIPCIDKIHPPVCLQVRRLAATFHDLLTQDQVPLDCQLLVYYRIDLRRADVGFIPQALIISAAGWNSLVESTLREIAAQVVGSKRLQQWLCPAGYRDLKRALGAALAVQVSAQGVIVSPRTAVSIQALKPAETILHTMTDRFTADASGEAALARVRPVVDELTRQHPELAWQVLLLEWAAAVVQQGNMPQMVLASADGLGQDRHIPDVLPAGLRAMLQNAPASPAEPDVQPGSATPDRHTQTAAP